MTDEHDKEDQEAFEALERAFQAHHTKHLQIYRGPRRPGRFIMHRETWEELCAISALFDKERED